MACKIDSQYDPAKTGHIIKYGPFAGMNYDVAASEGGGAPRLLGGYEASLAPIINDIVEAKPDLIIDVGCAEGYYAIGMARRLPMRRSGHVMQIKTRGQNVPILQNSMASPIASKSGAS